MLFFGGGEDTTFEAKAKAKDSEKVWGQGQGLDDTFENTRNYKCKYCNWFHRHSRVKLYKNGLDLSLLTSLF